MSVFCQKVNTVIHRDAKGNTKNQRGAGLQRNAKITHDGASDQKWDQVRDQRDDDHFRIPKQ